MMPGLRAREGLAGRAGHQVRPFRERVLELPAADQAKLMRRVEEEPAAPLGDDLLHRPDRLRKQRHRQAECHQLRPGRPGDGAEGVDVDHELGRVHRDIDDLAPHHAGGAVQAVGGVAAQRLGRRHDHVARGREGRVGHGVADHAGTHPVVGVAAAEIPLQQLDAECLDLVDVAGAGEPAVDPADMPFRGAGPDLGREQCPHARAGRGLGGEEVDALLPAPTGVACDGILHQLAHGGRVGTGIEKGAGFGQHRAVVDLDPVGGVSGVQGRPPGVRVAALRSASSRATSRSSIRPRSATA